MPAKKNPAAANARGPFITKTLFLDCTSAIVSVKVMGPTTGGRHSANPGQRNPAWGLIEYSNGFSMTVSPSDARALIVHLKSVRSRPKHR